MLALGIALTRVQDLARGPAEFHEVHVPLACQGPSGWQRVCAHAKRRFALPLSARGFTVALRGSKPLFTCRALVLGKGLLQALVCQLGPLPQARSYASNQWMGLLSRSG